MPLGDATELDFMLADCGDDVVFAGPPVTSTKGLIDRAQLLGDDGNGYQIAGTRTTVAVREGTQPAGLKEGATLTAAGIAFTVLDTGFVQADGLRKIGVMVT